jgi:hypothetical protein
MLYPKGDRFWEGVLRERREIWILSLVDFELRRICYDLFVICVCMCCDEWFCGGLGRDQGPLLSLREGVCYV